MVGFKWGRGEQVDVLAKSLGKGTALAKAGRILGLEA